MVRLEDREACRDVESRSLGYDFRRGHAVHAIGQSWLEVESRDLNWRVVIRYS